MFIKLENVVLNTDNISSITRNPHKYGGDHYSGIRVYMVGNEDHEYFVFESISIDEICEILNK